MTSKSSDEEISKLMVRATERAQRIINESGGEAIEAMIEDLLKTEDSPFVIEAIIKQCRHEDQKFQLLLEKLKERLIEGEAREKENSALILGAIRHLQMSDMRDFDEVDLSLTKEEKEAALGVAVSSPNPHVQRRSLQLVVKDEKKPIDSVMEKALQSFDAKPEILLDAIAREGTLRIPPKAPYAAKLKALVNEAEPSLSRRLHFIHYQQKEKSLEEWIRLAAVEEDPEALRYLRRVPVEEIGEALTGESRKHFLRIMSSGSVAHAALAVEFALGDVPTKGAAAENYRELIREFLRTAPYEADPMNSLPPVFSTFYLSLDFEKKSSEELNFIMELLKGGTPQRKRGLMLLRAYRGWAFGNYDTIRFPTMVKDFQAKAASHQSLIEGAIRRELAEEVTLVKKHQLLLEKFAYLGMDRSEWMEWLRNGLPCLESEVGSQSSDCNFFEFMWSPQGEIYAKDLWSRKDQLNREDRSALVLLIVRAGLYRLLEPKSEQEAAKNWAKSEFPKIKISKKLRDHLDREKEWQNSENENPEGHIRSMGMNHLYGNHPPKILQESLKVLRSRQSSQREKAFASLVLHQDLELMRSQSGLMEFTDQELRNNIKHLLNDRDPLVRWQALEALEEAPDPDHILKQEGGLTGKGDAEKVQLACRYYCQGVQKLLDEFLPKKGLAPFDQRPSIFEDAVFLIKANTIVAADRQCPQVKIGAFKSSLLDVLRSVGTESKSIAPNGALARIKLSFDRLLSEGRETARYSVSGLYKYIFAMALLEELGMNDTKEPSHLALTQKINKEAGDIFLNMPFLSESGSSMTLYAFGAALNHWRPPSPQLEEKVYKYADSILEASPSPFELPYNAVPSKYGDVGRGHENRNSVRGSVARSLSFHTALFRSDKKAFARGNKVENLLTALENYFVKHFDSLAAHLNAEGVHKGFDRLAPYYLYPSVFYSRHAFEALAKNSALSAQQKTRLENLKRVARDKVLSLIRENGEFKLTGDSKKQDESTFRGFYDSDQALGLMALKPFADCDQSAHVRDLPPESRPHNASKR